MFHKPLGQARLAKAMAGGPGLVPEDLLDDPGPEAQPPGMTREGPPAPLTPQRVRRRNLRDGAMLVLGAASVGLIAYDFLYAATLAPAQRALLEAVDLAVVLVFAAEFVWRWRGDGWRGAFVRRNWFDLLGMVPMMATNIPVFRAFRLVRVGIVASRLLRMWAYVTGRKSAQVVFDRYRAALVEEVTDRVMLRMLGTVEQLAARGDYVRALGESLQAARQDLAEAAVQGARADGVGRLVARLPGAEAAVRDAALAGVDSVSATLRSAEMQRAFEAAVRSVLAETRAEVARKAWRDIGAAPGPVQQRAPPPAKGL